MKRKIVFLAILFGATTFFIGCKKDKNNDVIGTEFDGTYKGTMEIKIFPSPTGTTYENQVINIKKTGDKELSLSADALFSAIAGMLKVDISSIKPEALTLVKELMKIKVTVVKTGATSCTFSGKTDLDFSQIPVESIKNIGKVTLEAKPTSKIEDKKVSIDMDASVGLIKTVVKFIGNKQ